MAKPFNISKDMFFKLEIGEVFQVRDGRIEESGTWILAVKVGPTSCRRLRVSGPPIPVPSDFIVTNKKMKILLVEE